MKDLHSLPKVRDSLSFLYVEHKKIDQEDKAIALHDAQGKIPVPCASLTSLLLGPGTSITHAAIRTLAENGCLVMWTGEGSVRFYAVGQGETRSARNLLYQSQIHSNLIMRLQVVRRLYEMRFTESLDPTLSLQQIRGKEGIRVREAYSRASRETGVKWMSRSYKRDNWNSADPINRALSAANSCLYGICHSAIVSAGFSPAIGFVHTGKMLSFVYDIADLYKVDVTVPLAFQSVAESTENLESRVRRKCRDTFFEKKILQRIVPDIEKALLMDTSLPTELKDFDTSDDPPADIWDLEKGSISGGTNWSDPPEEPKAKEE